MLKRLEERLKLSVDLEERVWFSVLSGDRLAIEPWPLEDLRGRAGFAKTVSSAVEVVMLRDSGLEVCS